MEVDEIDEYMEDNWARIEEQILARTYKPRPVKRVEIPKDNGGVRLLGVPCVIDRVIQQAMVQVLQHVPFRPLHRLQTGKGEDRVQLERRNVDHRSRDRGSIGVHTLCRPAFIAYARLRRKGVGDAAGSSGVHDEASRYAIDKGCDNQLPILFQIRNPDAEASGFLCKPLGRAAPNAQRQ